MRLVGYRAGLRAGIHPVLRLQTSRPSGPFFSERAASEPAGDGWAPLPPVHRLFGWLELPLDAPPPDWHFNFLSGRRSVSGSANWWRIPDFDPAVGDIKGIWEASRFGWAPIIADRAISGDRTAIPRLNEWVEDWILNNEPYRGPNWKCGQEASFRVMHLAMASLILDETSRALPGLIKLIEVHLQRILPTVSYARSQNNNHGTSEGAALFIGGTLLTVNGEALGRRFAQRGRKLLEERARRLIEPDGTFSQYSVNYHRVLLDTLSIAEIWRSAVGVHRFTENFYAQAARAASWLGEFCDRTSGGAPNTGANDGALLIPVTDADYRDYRPSAHLGSLLFAHTRLMAARGAWDRAPDRFKVDISRPVSPPSSSRVLSAGGYCLMRKGGAMVMLRFPQFRFRPSQSDVLHLDLWVDGVNHLRDGGSFSYNAAPEWLSYFGGTASHNTVQFDDRDQMPRLGRFLFGEWVEAEKVRELSEHGGALEFGAGYTDFKGARHERQVVLTERSLKVSDRVSGNFAKAVLRWRLGPGEWTLDGDSAVNGDKKLQLMCDGPAQRIEIVNGWESLYYGRKTQISVVEVEVTGAAEFRSVYSWRG